jgi:hypothetical protein
MRGSQVPPLCTGATVQGCAKKGHAQIADGHEGAAVAIGDALLRVVPIPKSPVVVTVRRGFELPPVCSTRL